MDKVTSESKKIIADKNNGECGQRLVMEHGIRPSHPTLTSLGLKGQNKMSDSTKKSKRLSYADQMEILRRLHAMESGKQLAQDFGVSCTTITVLKRKYGIPLMKKGPKQNVKKLTDDEKAKIATRLAKEAGASVMREIVMGSTSIIDLRKKQKPGLDDHATNQTKKLSLHDKIKIIEKLKNMESESDIGCEYGVCSKTICNIREQYELILQLAIKKRNSATRHMSDDKDKRRKHTRLTVDQKVEILLRLKNNEQGKILAKEYGVGTSTISDIKKAEEKILYIAERQGVDLDSLTIGTSYEDFENPQYIDSDSVDSETESTYTHVTCDVSLTDDDDDDLDNEEIENSEPTPMDNKLKELDESRCVNTNKLNKPCDGAKVNETHNELNDTSPGEAYAALFTAIKWAEQQIEIDNEQINTLKAIKNIAFRKHLLNLNFSEKKFNDS